MNEALSKRAIEDVAAMMGMTTEEVNDAVNVAHRAYGGRYCAACGEREHSSYAKPCCTPDNMIEE